MRFIPVLLISVALATASGCFGKDDENGDGTTTTPTGTGTMTPTGSGTTTPTGATPTSPTAGGNNTGPVKPAPKELCPVSKDFAGNTPAPGTPPPAITTGDCGAVTTGYTKIKIDGNFTANAGAPIQIAQGVAVKVLDAAGTAVLTCAGPGPGPAATTPCTQEGGAVVGAYTLQFEGTGTVTFTGSVTVS